MSVDSDSKYKFLLKRHINYFLRCLHILPSHTISYDTSRTTTLFFTLSGMDILNALHEISDEDKSKIIEWIYSLQVIPTKDMKCGGFRGGNSLACLFHDHENRPQTVAELDSGHIAMTYTAMGSLIILGDDLSRINRTGIQEHIQSLQCPDGSFLSTTGGSENDIRFVYCAATICYILQDFSPLNIDSAVNYIIGSLRYEGGFGQGPDQEAHGGPTFCAVAALHLMGKLDVLTPLQRERLVRWLMLRQSSSEGGLQGRPNKSADTCYSFWIGAALKLLGSFRYLDHKEMVQFLLSAQDPILGGLGKFVGVGSDGLHTYFGISGLSLIDQELSGLELNLVDPSLNISNRALKHLRTLHKNWSLNS